MVKLAGYTSQEHFLLLSEIINFTRLPVHTEPTHLHASRIDSNEVK